MSIDFVAWHDRTTANHKEMLDQSAAAGYRTISLCVYGDRHDPRYASVMTKKHPTPATRQFFGLTLAGFQSKFDEMAKEGWGPYLVTATGPRNDPVVAAVFTPMNPIPLTRYDLTAKDLADLNSQAWHDGLILASADAYGTPDDVRFIAVWHPNTPAVAWNLQAVSEPTDLHTLQQRFTAITSQGGRPAHIAITPANTCTELFVDSAQEAWASRANMTSAGYQSAFDTFTREGLAPVCVAAQGNGADTRFAAIFAKSEHPVPRTLRATGSPAITAIDGPMEDFIKAHQLRGAALAIVQGTRLVYARGYTYAEPNYPDVQPTSLFRLASVSKTITAAAVYQLIHENRLTLDTTVQSVLRLKTPDGKDPVDPRFHQVTIRHLLESNSSLPRGALWNSVEAAAAFGKPLPATHAQLASYIASLRLEGDKAPGDPKNVMYNNTGYFMLGQVVARLRGTDSLATAIVPGLLEPLGISRIRGSRSLHGAQASDEARYHLSNLHKTTADDNLGSLGYGTSVRTPDRPLVPWQYGVDDYEMFDGAGGMSAAVTDLARLVAALGLRDHNPVLTPASLDALFTNAATATRTLSGPDPHGYHGLDWASVLDATNHVYRAEKGGWLSSNQSVIEITTGGLSYVMAINGNMQNEVATDWFAPVSAAAEAQSWANTDLFPQFGMPSFSAPSRTISVPSVEPGIGPHRLMTIMRRSMTVTRHAPGMHPQ
jgi:CubicO group peptidase (beta-lactamase class C family)